MNSKSNSYEEENIARGCLKLNNKIYPVFEGLNTVGRSPEAIINLKHLNISKQHAIITITDEGVHYISDFSSSNGTILDNTKLNPLKLYRLDNGASIKFADIFCTYKTLSATEKLTNNAEESQILDDSFYAAGTQTIELPEVHEIGINEMATQIMTPKATSFNEMDTEIQTLDDTSGDSIDFSTMQKAESQMISRGTGFSEISPSKVNSSDLLKSDDDEPPLSQIRPVKTGRKKLIESDHESDTDDEVEHVPEKNMSRYVISDDSETDIENEEEKDMDEADVVIPMTQDGEQKTSEEPSISSLAVSEQINDEAGEQRNEEMPTDETVGSIKDAEKEDERVIKDAEKEDERVNENETLAKDDLPSSEEIDVLHYEGEKNEDEGKVVMEEGKDEEDNVGPSSEDKTDRPTPQVDTEFANSKKDQKDGNFEVDQNLQRGEELEISKSNNQTNEDISEEGGSEKIEDAFDQQTQQVDFDFVNHGEVNLEKSEESKIVEDQDDVVTADKLDFEDHNTPDLYLQSTQPLDKNDERSKDKEEADFLPPTQALRILHGDGEEGEAGMLNDGSSSKTNGDEDNDYFQQSTQSLADLLGNDKIENSVSEEKEDQDEMGLARTQSLELIHGEEILMELKNDSLAVNKERLLVSKDKEDEDVFLSPTKALDHLLSEGSPGIGKNRSKEKLSRSRDIEEDDSFILPPTQAMELLHKDDSNFNQVEDQLAEIFTSQNDILLGTQQLVDVLETTHDDDVVDDSFAEDFGRSTRSKSWIFKKPEPISVDLVKEILEEDIKSIENKKEVKSVSEENADDKLEEQTEKEGKVTAKSNKEKEDGEKVESKQVRKAETKDDKNIGKNKRETRKQSMVRFESQEGKDEEKKKNSQGDDDEKKVGRKETKMSNKEVQRNVEKEEDKKGQKSKTKVENEKEFRIGEGGRRSTRSQVSNDDKKKSGSQVRKEKTMEIDTGNLSLEIKKKKEKSSSNDGRMEGKEEGKEKQQVTNKKDQNEDQSNVETRRSRRQQNITKDQKSKLEVDQGSDSTDNNSQESGENKRRTRRTKDSQESTVEVDKSDSNEEGGNSRRSKRKENINSLNQKQITTNASKKKESQSSNEEETPNTRRTSKRKKDDKQENKEMSPIAKKRVTVESEEGNKKRDKENDEGKGTPKKRSLKVANVDSGDEFEAKIPKLQNSSDKTTPTKAKTSSEPTRKSTRNAKKITPDDEDTALSSSSIQNDVSSSSTIDESALRRRRLSANSRRLKKEEEMKGDKKEEEMKGEKKEEEMKGEKKTVTRRASAVKASPGMLTTPERFKRQTKPKVVFTMMDNPELESLIRQLGGSVVDTVDACTVLVTESVKRSQKLLCAVGQGKPICSPKWLEACKKAYSFVDPWNYILVDREAEKKWSFSLRESLNRSAKTKLLENHTFQLIVNNAADVLKGAIEACGGKCVTRNLAKSGTDNLIIVSSENNRSKYSKILKQNPEIKVVEAEAIFDGTLRQEFRFNKHLLS